MAGAIAACRPAERAPSAHLADGLPASVGAVLAWQGGVPPWVVAESWSMVPAVRRAAPPRGAIGALRGMLDRREPPAELRDSWAAVLEFTSEAEARSGLGKLVEGHPSAPGRWRQEGKVVRGELEASAEGRLGEQIWFRALRQGLGVDGGAATEVFVDLRALHLADSARLPVGRLPGLDSFLAFGGRLEESAGPRLRCFVRLARNPVGIAKAIDAEAAPLGLPALLERAGVASYVVERFKPQVIVDALLMVTASGAAGVFGPGPADVLRSLHSGLGLLFRRDFWACLGDEWAIGWRDQVTDMPCVVNALVDRSALLAQLAEVEVQEGPLRLRRSADGERVVFEIGGFGHELVGVVGPKVAVLAPASRRELALAIAGGVITADPWRSPLEGASRDLVGAGCLRGPLPFVSEAWPFGLAERLRRPSAAIVWQVSRAGDGLRLDAQLR